MRDSLSGVTRTQIDADNALRQNTAPLVGSDFPASHSARYGLRRILLGVAGLRRSQEFAQRKVEKKIAGQTCDAEPQYERDFCAGKDKKMFDRVHVYRVCSRTSYAEANQPPAKIDPSPDVTMRRRFL